MNRKRRLTLLWDIVGTTTSEHSDNSKKYAEVASIIDEALFEQDRDTRHACAEICLANNNEYLHDAIMNCREGLG